MMKTKLNTATLLVGAASYTVAQADDHKMQGAYGSTHHGRREMLLNSQSTGHSAPDEVLNTFIHEVLHVAWAASHLPVDVEEEAVTKVADRLVEMFVRNPDFVKDIQQLSAASRKALNK